MFYSQLVVNKREPLAKVWVAAHWGDKKFDRQQIFKTDISKSVDTIVEKESKLALRVSGHLLLGVVRIYSRRVKYVLHDCTEAMVKLQMTFSRSGGATSKDETLLEVVKATANQDPTTIANFGEYQPLSVVDGSFMLPLPDESEWILADPAEADEWQEADSQRRYRIGSSTDDTSTSGRGGFGSASGFHTPFADDASHSRHSIGNASTIRGPQDIDFDDEPLGGEFDPNDDLDPKNESLVSDVEVVRDAGPLVDRSFDVGGASTVAATPIGKEGEARPSFIPGDAPFPDVGGAYDDDAMPPPLPGDDDDDGINNANVNARESSLNGSSISGSARGSLRAATSIGGLDSISEDDHSATKPSAPSAGQKRAAAAAERRRMKRRQVVIDNNQIELSNAEIKDMLKDSKALVRTVPHPAEWDEDDDEGDEQGGDADYLRHSLAGFGSVHRGSLSRRDPHPNVEALPYHDRLLRPGLADRGYLHPELMLLWTSNFYSGREQAPPYERVAGDDDDDDDDDSSDGSDDRDGKGDEADAMAAQRAEDEAEAIRKRARSGEGDDEDSAQIAIAGDDASEGVGGARSQQRTDAGAGFDDEGMPLPADVDDNNDDDMGIGIQAGEDDYNDDHMSLGSFGMVNEFDLGDDDDTDGDGEATDDNAPSGGQRVMATTTTAASAAATAGGGGGEGRSGSTARWHRHTVQVLESLQRRMGKEGGQRRQSVSQLSFNQLSRRLSRHDAASVFFELLQLKTWNFIEVDQDSAYGDIIITPAERFDESPPGKQS